MVSTPVRVEGLAELEAALAELGKATGRAVLRRVAKKRLQPIAAAMKAKAPDDPGTHGNDLRSSITVSEKLSPRQASLAGGGPKMTAGGFKSEAKNGITVYAGAGPLPQAHMTEFGTVNMAAQPWARPAWDSGKNALLPGLGQDLKAEIDKAVARKAKRRR